jgi:hypothetical protein
MTAEIAILNKNGVALAADSKVTLSGGKTFDTANKIFSLSKFHPVGIMIFGNAEFMGFPWETIVKTYRSKKQDRGENTIAQWGTDFTSFLSTFTSFDDSDKKNNLVDVIESWFDHIHQLAMAELEDRSEATTQEIYNAAILRQLNRQIRRFEKAEIVFNDQYMNAFKDTYGPVAKKLIESTWDASSVREVATSFVWMSISRNLFSPNSSGIVVAGFGCEELFPALVHYDTDGYLGKEIKVNLRRHRQISRKRTSSIVPFAQGDMVARFMDGIDPEYSRFIHVMFTKATISACKAVLDKYGKEESKTEEVFSSIIAAAMESAKQTSGEAVEFQKKKFSNPIVSMIAMLSKDELPNLAESLVALTSLKRHVSEDAETVGGPIDVALISKGDGLIWIKRKHYFKPELNPSFFANYFRNVTHRGVDDEQAPEDGKLRGSPRRQSLRPNGRKSRPGAADRE